MGKTYQDGLRDMEKALKVKEAVDELYADLEKVNRERHQLMQKIKAEQDECPHPMKDWKSCEPGRTGYQCPHCRRDW